MIRMAEFLDNHWSGPSTNKYIAFGIDLTMMIYHYQ
jgi:hypothetical protein